MTAYSRTTSRGIPVVTPAPSGTGGDLFNDALIALAAQSAPFHRHAGAPDSDDDSEDTGGNGAAQTRSLWWDTTNKVLYWCTDASEGAATWETLTSTVGYTFIPIPLTNWRAVDGTGADAEIHDITDSPATDDKYGSLLHKGTFPVLDIKDGDTNCLLRIVWAANAAAAIARAQLVTQVPLPLDLDKTADLELHFRARMVGATDMPAIDIGSWFNEADTKVADSSAVLVNEYAERTIYIAAADVPSDAQTLTIKLTPQAHENDAIRMTATWLEYTRLHLTW